MLYPVYSITNLKMGEISQNWFPKMYDWKGVNTFTFNNLRIKTKVNFVG